MQTLWFTPIICLIGAASFSGSAFAADKKATKMVAEMAQARDALLQKYPAIALIDSAVRADCAAKGKDAPPEGAFCSCASAVTFGLWMSDMDPKMNGRLNGFLQQPSESAASEFTAYQGPEMYTPLCSKAV